MTISIVQATSQGNSGGLSTTSGSLPANPQAGNLVIAVLADRDAASTATSILNGFTRNFDAVSSLANVPRITVLSKVSTGGGDAKTWAFTSNGSWFINAWGMFEVAGLVSPVYDTGVDAADYTGATPTNPAITPAAGKNALLLAIDWMRDARPNPGPVALTNHSAVIDTGFAMFGNLNRLVVYRREVALTSGAYGGEVYGSSGNAGQVHNISGVSFVGSVGQPRSFAAII